MRNTLKLALAAVALMISSSAVAHAQCKDKVFIDSVYQTGTGGDKYDYYVQVRNQTDKPVKFDLFLGGFGPKVSLYSGHLPGIELGKGGNKTIKIGTGTKGDVGHDTVAYHYDGVLTGKAFVSASGCKF